MIGGQTVVELFVIAVYKDKCLVLGDKEVNRDGWGERGTKKDLLGQLGL